MAAADEDALRAELEAARREMEAEFAGERELDAELEEAAVRQRLRSEIARVRGIARRVQQRNRTRAEFRADVDADRAFLHGGIRRAGKIKKFIQNSSGQGITQCNQQVARGEYVWTLTGMRWLKDALLWADCNTYVDFAESARFEVGWAKFRLIYNPEAGCLELGHCGSLAIRYYVPYENHSAEADISLMYNIYIKARDGSFRAVGRGGSRLL